MCVKHSTLFDGCFCCGSLSGFLLKSADALLLPLLFAGGTAGYCPSLFWLSWAHKLVALLLQFHKKSMDIICRRDLNPCWVVDSNVEPSNLLNIHNCQGERKRKGDRKELLVLNGDMCYCIIGRQHSYKWLFFAICLSNCQCSIIPVYTILAGFIAINNFCCGLL